jgi:hypothetical protein
MHPLRRAHFVAVDAALDQPQFVLCIVGSATELTYIPFILRLATVIPGQRQLSHTDHAFTDRIREGSHLRPMP